MKVSIAGCAGRMGKELLLKAIADQSENRCKLIGGTVTSDSQLVGMDLGKIAGLDNINISATTDLNELAKQSDVIIDFTSPESSLKHAKICAEHGISFVCGTTGFTDSQMNELKELAKKTPILWSANMSLGINLLMKLSRDVAENLNEDFDIAISESHHKHKVDAPSGTALMIGKSISENTDHKISYSSIRAGDIVGEHTVMFAGMGERLELNHIASNRSIFANGAFKAASWLINKPASKLFSMQDVLA